MNLKPFLSRPPFEPVTGGRWWNGLRLALFVVFVGILLAYGAHFAGYLVSHLNVVDLMPILNPDDAHYYFQIARNFAAGKFSTFDGGISQTNGYHPLWALLITPFYWVFDKEQALFGIKAFEIMLVSGSVALVAAAARLARLHWILLFAMLPALYGNTAFYHGMEAAAAAFMLGLFLLAICLYAKRPARWKWALAGVAFALPWVRLEYLAISLAGTATLFFVEWGRHEHPFGRVSLKELARSRPATVPLAGACAGILAYFAYNRMVFGVATPVSAVIRRRSSRGLWEREGGYSLEQNLEQTLQIGVFDYELFVVLEVGVYLLLIWWLARRFRRQQDWLLLAFLLGVSALAAGHLAKFVQTVLTVHPYYGSYPYYFVPAYLLTELIIPVRCWVAIHLIRHWVGRRSAVAANLLVVGVVLATAAFLLQSTRYTLPVELVDWLSGPAGDDPRLSLQHPLTARYLGVFVMDRLLPEGSVVGSWNSGVIGYFSRFPVVNLDGLTNSYDYAMAGYTEQTDQTPEFFFSKYGITHFVDHMYLGEFAHARKDIDNSTGKTSFAPFLFEGVTTGRRAFRLWARPGAASHGEQGEQVRHFDPDSGWRIWLIVDGGVAQAFAKSCTSDEVAVWWWSDADGRHETTVDDWTKTAGGWCWSGSRSPRDGKIPERVEKMTMDDWVRRGAS